MTAIPGANVSRQEVEWLNFIMSASPQPLQEALNQGAAAVGQFGAKTDNTFKKVGQDAENMGRSVGRGARTMQDVLTAAAQGIAALNLARLITEPTKAFANFEATLNTYRAVSGATVGEMKKLTDEVTKQGKATQYSSQQIAQTTVEMAKLGMTTDQTLKALPGVIAAAAASGSDLAFTAELVAGSLAGFGLEASKATLVADTLARTANVSSASMEDLFYTFKFMAPVARGANQELSVMAASTSLLANQMIKGATAGTSLRSILTSLQSGSKEVTEIFEQFNIKVSDQQGKLLSLDKIFLQLQEKFKNLTDIQKNQKLEQLFGREALSAAQVLMSTSQADFGKMIRSFQNVNGESKKTADIINQGLAHSFGMLTSSIETVSIEFGKFYAGPIVLVLDGLTALVNVFGELPEPIKAVTAALVGLIATAGVITMGMGAMSLASGHVTAALAGIPKAFGMIASWGSTVMGVITRLLSGFAPLIALAGGLYLAWQTNLGGLRGHMEKFMDFVRDNWGVSFEKTITRVKEIWETAIEGMKTSLLELFNVVDTPMKHFLNMIEEISKSLGYLSQKDLKMALVHAEAAKAHATAFTDSVVSTLERTKATITGERDTTAEHAAEVEAARKKLAPTPEAKAKEEAEKKKAAAGTGGGGGLADLDKVLQKMDTRLSIAEKNLEAKLKTIEAEKAQATATQVMSLDGRASFGGYTMTSPFGWRTHPIFGTGRMHTGQDFGMPEGTPIQAVAPGKIKLAKKQGGYGNAVEVDHGGGYTTFYAHGQDDSYFVKAGQEVKKGDQLMRVGSTGYSTGPHLHYEVRKDGVAVDPATATQIAIKAEAEAAKIELEKKKKEILPFLQQIDKEIAILQQYTNNPEAQKKIAELNLKKADRAAALRDTESQIHEQEARQAAAAAEKWLEEHKQVLEQWFQMRVDTEQKINAMQREIRMSSLTDEKSRQAAELDNAVEDIASYVEKRQAEIDKLYNTGHISDKERKDAAADLRREEELMLDLAMRRVSLQSTEINDIEKQTQLGRDQFGLLEKQLEKLREYNSMMTGDAQSRKDTLVRLQQQLDLLNKFPGIMGEAKKQEEAKVRLAAEIADIQNEIYNLTDKDLIAQREKVRRQEELRKSFEQIRPIAEAIGDSIMTWADGLAKGNAKAEGLLDVAKSAAGALQGLATSDWGKLGANVLQMLMVPGQVQAKLDAEKRASNQGLIDASFASNENNIGMEKSSLQGKIDRGELDKVIGANMLQDLNIQLSQNKLQNLRNNYANNPKFQEWAKSAFRGNGYTPEQRRQADADLAAALNGDIAVIEKYRNKITAMSQNDPALLEFFDSIKQVVKEAESNAIEHNETVKKITEEEQKAAEERKKNSDKNIKDIDDWLAKRKEQAKQLQETRELEAMPDGLDKVTRLVNRDFDARAQKITDDYRSKSGDLQTQEEKIELLKLEAERVTALADAKQKYNEEAAQSAELMRLETAALKARLTETVVDDAAVEKARALRDLALEESAAVTKAPPEQHNQLRSYYAVRRQLIQREFDDKIEAYRKSRLEEISKQAIAALDLEKEKIKENLDLQSQGYREKVAQYQAKLDQLDREKEQLQDELAELQAKKTKELDAQDQGKGKAAFIDAMGSVDLISAISRGLELISNMNQRTYIRTSKEAQGQGLDAQIDFLEREANAQLKYEKITTSEHAQAMKQTALLRARYAQQRLDTETLNRSKTLELEEQIADAYVQFKEYEKKAIEERYAVEERKIDTNMQLKDQEMRQTRQNMTEQQALIDALTKEAETKYAQVDQRIKEINKSLREQSNSIKATGNDFTTVLLNIMNQYDALKTKMESGIKMGVQAGSGGSGGGGTGSTGTSSGAEEQKSYPLRVRTSQYGDELVFEVMNGSRVESTVRGRSLSAKPDSTYWLKGQRGYYKSPDDLTLVDMLYNYDPREFPTFHTGGIMPYDGLANLSKGEITLPPNLSELLLSVANRGPAGIGGPIIINNHVDLSGASFARDVDVSGSIAAGLGQSSKIMASELAPYRRAFG